MHLVPYNKLIYMCSIYLMHMHHHLLTGVVLILLKVLNPVLFFSPGDTSGPHTNHISMASCFPISVIHEKLFRLSSAKQKIS